MLEDKANLALLQRLMTAPTLDSYVAKGRAEVTRWAQLHYQNHTDASPSSHLKEGVCHLEEAVSHLKEEERGQEMPRLGIKVVTQHTDAPPLSYPREEERGREMPRQEGDRAATLTRGGGGGGAGGGGGWWCVKAAGGNGGMDIWVLHEGNWRAVTQNLRDGESYVIQVCARVSLSVISGQVFDLAVPRVCQRRVEEAFFKTGHMAGEMYAV